MQTPKLMSTIILVSIGLVSNAYGSGRHDAKLQSKVSKDKPREKGEGRARRLDRLDAQETAAPKQKKGWVEPSDFVVVERHRRAPGGHRRAPGRHRRPADDRD